MFYRSPFNKQKIVRSWKLYWAVVLIVFIIAVAISECAASNTCETSGCFVDTETVMTCDFYRVRIKSTEFGVPYLTEEHIGHLEVRFKKGWKEDDIREIVDKIDQSLLKEHTITRKCETVTKGLEFGIGQGFMGRKF